MELKKRWICPLVLLLPYQYGTVGLPIQPACELRNCSVNRTFERTLREGGTSDPFSEDLE